MDLKSCFPWILIQSLILSCLFRPGRCLTCYVGLGNTSERDRQPSIVCRQDKYHVCAKMSGGGMGDQIKRFCELLSPEEYESVQDYEARILEGEIFDSDPNCFLTKDKGRRVFICRCSTDRCNTSQSLDGLPLQLVLAVSSAFFIFR
ncbi:uncharacterized protein LOC111698747 isoform X2 [Eurytemora carolleeae]|uniref:uncharacterized protein LOC111698747 isoform X2 n=1 Tax=Eurytemora carolleeae TaxID=1294199 RepID=UPI000C794D7B|nr:uncharacterized protein LOC111698747 isoform X2 [Eurytemora carolleeae]|eukprot:XP_023324932.1 uncharacterized protein LOC111698747 isoform X2 [Eurytemora affinis]